MTNRELGEVRISCRSHIDPLCCFADIRFQVMEGASAHGGINQASCLRTILPPFRISSALARQLRTPHRALLQGLQIGDDVADFEGGQDAAHRWHA